MRKQLMMPVVCIAIAMSISRLAFGGGGLFLGGDQFWDNPDNWENGVPELEEGPDINIYYNQSGGNGPIIEDGIDAEGGSIILGNIDHTIPAGSEIVLTMTGGTLDVWKDFWIGWEEPSFPEIVNDGPGVFNISGGTVTMFEHPEEQHNHLILGKGSDGTVNQTGGSVFTQVLALDWWSIVAPNTNGPDGGYYNLHGGTLDVTRPNGIHPIFFGTESLMDITEGVMTVGGDLTAYLKGIINAGRITAYGGEGQVMMDFDLTNPGKTTVWGENDLYARLNDGTLTDLEERKTYVREMLNTWIGDSNKDGQFSSSDLVLVLGGGEYEDTTEDNSTWEEGDWNGDMDFVSSDLVYALSDGGYEAGLRTATAAVPEPRSVVLLLMAAVRLVRRRPPKFTWR